MPTPERPERSVPPSRADRPVSTPSTRQRRRSFCFLEREGERWTVFLVTEPGGDGQWRGHFAFRPSNAEPGGVEYRTTDLFLESGEAAVDARARSLGRPLLSALLESVLHTEEKRRDFSPNAQGRFRRLLAQHSAEIAPDLGDGTDEPSLSHLRSLYDSYRLDQMAHLISLTRPDDFRRLVERILDGREIDFRSRDRLQLAMLVVQELEQYVPLPPFEVWVEDYLENREEYHRYSHALHREGELTD